jgi:ATP-dependent DNA helicase RecG
LAAQDDLAERLLGQLPFGLTGAQQRAVAEISADLAQPYPMQRLLQGDVGAGKTMVAALAACQAISAGWQAAFMAPTEILAEQHYLKLKDWLEPLGVQGRLAVRQPENGSQARATGERRRPRRS